MMRATWKAGILLLIAFVLGAGAGAAIAWGSIQQRRWGGSRDRTENYLRLLDGALDLRAEQRDARAEDGGRSGQEGERRPVRAHDG